MASDRLTQPDGSKVIDAHTPAEQLPDDIHLLRQMVLQLLANVDSLQHELGWYKRHLFGRRSEKLDPNQQMLFDLLGAAIEERQAACQAPVKNTSPRPSCRNGRVPLPQHLPRERIEYHPPEQALQCPVCGQRKEPMGEEVTEQLDYVPASFIVRQHVRVKYACKRCQEGVVIVTVRQSTWGQGMWRPGCRFGMDAT